MWAALLLFLCCADVSQLSNVTVRLETQLPVGSEVEIKQCPITFLGQRYNWIKVDAYSSAFFICYLNAEGERARDCVYMNVNNEAASFNLTILDGGIRKRSIEEKFPNLTLENSNCYINIGLKNQQNVEIFSVTLDGFGAQSFCTIESLFNHSSFGIYIMNGGDVISSHTMESGVDNITIDTSRCRHEGMTYKRGSYIDYNPDTCETLLCTNISRINRTGCTASQTCIDSRCEVSNLRVCTVSGRTIVSFHEDVVNIPDRCTYTLVTNKQGNFKLYGKFQERRRRDVALLSEVILDFNGEIFYLKQGSKLEKDAVEHPVGPGVLEMDGVRFSKSQQGVTASLRLGQRNLTVIFDGNTVHVIALDGARLTGPCGDLTNPQDTVSASPEWWLSDPGCSSNFRDPDPAINCTDATEYCEALTRPPFALCHRHLDPIGFIASCTSILCHYPAVDNIQCHLLKAYVTACNLLAPNTLTNWRPSVGCGEPTVDLCLDTHCSENEFCGQTRGGEARCFCRAIFAADFQFTNTFGGPVICNSTSATISLANCLLEERRIDYRTLALRDRSCRGSFNNQTHQVTFFYDSQNLCQTHVMQNESHIIYNNSITVDSASQNRIITRQRQIGIDFSCVHFKPAMQTVVFRVRGSSVLQRVVGYWTYSLVMTAFLDETLTRFIGPSTELRLDQPVWVKIEAIGLDNPHLALVTEACWMTPSSDASLEHFLVMNGCANLLDGTVVVDTNGVGMFNIFSFNMFEFVGHVSDLNLHCRVQICNTLVDDCVPNCEGEGSERSRRSTDEEDSIISMQWNIEEPN